MPRPDGQATEAGTHGPSLRRVRPNAGAWHLPQGSGPPPRPPPLSCPDSQTQGPTGRSGPGPFGKSVTGTWALPARGHRGCGLVQRGHIHVPGACHHDSERRPRDARAPAAAGLGSCPEGHAGFSRFLLRRPWGGGGGGSLYQAALPKTQLVFLLNRVTAQGGRTDGELPSLSVRASLSQPSAGFVCESLLPQPSHRRSRKPSHVLRAILEPPPAQGVLGGRLLSVPGCLSPSATPRGVSLGTRAARWGSGTQAGSGWHSGESVIAASTSHARVVGELDGGRGGAWRHTAQKQHPSVRRRGPVPEGPTARTPVRRSKPTRQRPKQCLESPYLWDRHVQGLSPTGPGHRAPAADPGPGPRKTLPSATPAPCATSGTKGVMVGE